MSHSRMRSGLVRVLAVYLVLALTPTPLVVSWFLTRSSPAAAAVEEEEDLGPATPPSLTDLAPPQPRLISPSSDGPAARLARMTLDPRELSREEEQAASGIPYASAAEVRDAQLADLADQLGSQALAEAVIIEFEKPRAGTAPLHTPVLEPAIPDPFVPLPARANYKRADQITDPR